MNLDKADAEVTLDLKIIAGLKPEQRLKWLVKALKMASDGGTSGTELFNIVAHRKFAGGLSERVAKKMLIALKEGLEIFSDKQQRHLFSSDCPIDGCLVPRSGGGAPHHVDADYDAVAASNAAAEEVERRAAAEADAAVDAALERRERREELKLPSDTDQRSLQKSAVPPPAGGDRRESRGSSGAPAAQDVQQRPISSFPAAREREISGQWQVAEDVDSRRRQAAMDTELKIKEARRKEQGRVAFQEAEEQQRNQQAVAAEAERQRKLEEEADSIFMRAVESRPEPEREVRRKSISRSRSISSRTARRIARKNGGGRGPKPGDWRTQVPPSELSGSRAIFLNKSFVEDLPHMPRPAVSGTVGVGGRMEEPEFQRRGRGGGSGGGGGGGGSPEPGSRRRRALRDRSPSCRSSSDSRPRDRRRRRSG